MKNVLKAVVVLGMVFFYTGAMTSCREKTEEEEKDKKIGIKLNKPFTVWETGWSGEKITQFSITFTKTGYELIPPGQIGTEEGKVTYFIDYTCKNLGPRQGNLSFSRNELRVDEGYIYPGYSSNGALLDPGGQGKGRLEFQIPPDTVPVEATGISFSLSLPRLAISESEAEIVTVADRDLQVDRCYLTGFGKNPSLHLEYKNISGKNLEIKIAIEWRDNNRRIQGQKDFRGPASASQGEKLVYKIGVRNPEKVIRYGVDLATKVQGSRGLVPFKWGWHGSYPQVGPREVQKKIGEQKEPSKAGPTREEAQAIAQRKETGGIGGIPDDAMKWVKCNDPACKADYEMGLKTYYKELQENMNPNPMATSPTALTCKECNKRSLYGAEKCANTDCGTVFIEGISGPDDFADRCPDCGKSETQESRKRRLRSERVE